MAFGFLDGLIAMPFIEFLDWREKFGFFSILLLASILPDIDHAKSKISTKIPIIPLIISLFFKHRGIIHSIYFALLASFFAYYYLGYVYALAMLIGYTSHLIADGLTKSGINFLHPFSSRSEER